MILCTFSWNKRSELHFHTVHFKLFIMSIYITYILTCSMQHSPSWEANRFSFGQEIPHILRNRRVHYRIHKCPPPVPILIHLDPVHTTTSHFLKIHLSIVLPSPPGSPKWSLSFTFPHQSTVYTSPLPHWCYIPPTSSKMWSREQYWVRSTDHETPHYVIFSTPCHLVPLRPKCSPQ